MSFFLFRRYAYLKVFNRFKWHNVASLTQDGHKYSEYIGHLQDLLQKNDINYILDKKFREDFSTEDMKMVSIAFYAFYVRKLYPFNLVPRLPIRYANSMRFVDN